MSHSSHRLQTPQIQRQKLETKKNNRPLCSQTKNTLPLLPLMIMMKLHKTAGHGYFTDLRRPPNHGALITHTANVNDFQKGQVRSLGIG